MSTISWAEFKAQIEKQIPKERCFSAVSHDGASKPIYRGHASNKWSLETTLDRRTQKDMSLGQYMRDCASARRHSGNFTPNTVPFDENVCLNYSSLRVHFPNFEYLAFLRHHGFPSPLLDWTESPYVAAFFAFRNKAPPDASAARVFLYQASVGQGHSFCTADPHLISLGPFITAHERHAIQQCWYTVAIQDKDTECYFCSHEEAFEISRKVGGTQDHIQIFDIDLADREEALSDLYSMNISAFTLFRSLDSLMETTSHRIFEKE